MATIRVQKTHTQVVNGSTDFGILDQKGRKIGYAWTIDAVKCELHTAEEGSCWEQDADAPMSYFELVTTPTRDGRGYGPSFNRAEALTLEEAHKIIVKRTENARKRDTKKFVK